VLARCNDGAVRGKGERYEGWVAGKYYNVMAFEDPCQCFLFPRSWWAVDECQRVRVRGLLPASSATASSATDIAASAKRAIRSGQWRMRGSERDPSRHWLVVVKALGVGAGRRRRMQQRRCSNFVVAVEASCRRGEGSEETRKMWL
jgi:hypothetical protein